MIVFKMNEMFLAYLFCLIRSFALNHPFILLFILLYFTLFYLFFMFFNIKIICYNTAGIMKTVSSVYTLLDRYSLLLNEQYIHMHTLFNTIYKIIYMEYYIYSKQMAKAVFGISPTRINVNLFV